MTSDERFERIERTLERITEKVDRIAVGNIELGEKVDRIAEGHIELEGAQLNQQRVHAQLEVSLKSFIDETKERIENLTILVDRLVARDLGA